jgi:phage tail sheath gpL-like
MTIDPTSLAAINGVGVENQKFAVTASVIPQKNVIIGTFDESTFTLVAPNVPIRVYSGADVGGKTGYGFMLHRLARAAFKAGSVETWIIPQLEGGSTPAAAIGEIDFSASASVQAGVLACYIAGDRVAINVALDDTGDDIGDALADAINADDNMPVTAVNVAGVVTLTSKSGGDWGNDISIDFSLSSGEALPTGVSAVVTDMAGGSGVPDIQDALDALGTGDGQNEEFFTNLIHGYGADTATLDAISTYNGIGNTLVGNYKKEVARPFRSLVGSVASGTVGLSAALAFAALRRTDRTNGKICVPGSQNHPQEIAAQMLGLMAVTNSIRAEEGYIDKALDGVWPGDIADRWTNDYDNRDQAVKGGVSTTMIKNKTIVYAQNIITFYRPTDVEPESNGYRPMRNISIIQNVLYNVKANFERTKWKGITICEDVTKVTNPTDSIKARDIDSVEDDIMQLADAFAGNAWIYQAAYTKQNQSVSLRAGLTGFDINIPLIFSGEGGIYNSLIPFDTSIAILSVGGA